MSAEQRMPQRWKWRTLDQTMTTEPDGEWCKAEDVAAALEQARREGAAANPMCADHKEILAEADAAGYRRGVEAMRDALGRRDPLGFGMYEEEAASLLSVTEAGQATSDAHIVLDPDAPSLSLDIRAEAYGREYISKTDPQIEHLGERIEALEGCLRELAVSLRREERGDVLTSSEMAQVLARADALLHPAPASEEEEQP